MLNKFTFILSILLIVIIACSQEEDYSQLQDWRSELRTEILEARSRKRTIKWLHKMSYRSQISCS